MKGRKPQLAVIAGDALPGGCPGPAAWLSPFAKEEWRRVAPLLHERQLLAADTMATLESYCVAVGVVRECYQPPATGHGDLFQAPGSVQSPAQMKIMFAAMREARLLAAELGLTPHRRVQMGDTGEVKRGDWENDLLA
jgi:P27 family predicted phage terminase small subunit